MFCLFVATVEKWGKNSMSKPFYQNIKKELLSPPPPPLTLLGNLLEHPEERLRGISTQRGQVLGNQQVEELADVGEATNITNGIAKVELKNNQKKVINKQLKTLIKLTL